jgi:1-deoxy-D-xylulose-5-phosphate synthase
VVGDGAMTGGLAWEALNNLGSSGRHVVVVLNDNGCSYSPTVGGLARHLRRLHPSEGYAEVQRLLGGDAPLDPAVPTERRAPANFFEHLGLTYLGPVDGHDIAAVESALQQAAVTDGPVVVHVRTVKGHGYAPAELDEADHLHTVGIVDRVTGRPPTAPAGTWTDAFADALLELGGSRPDLVAISAAMLGPTGLQRFGDRFPQRCFDVGIAEQHALTSAAGLAMGGKHPVVALYATFANRAFDQTLLDVGLHQLPVTLVLDRAGVTGPDGASHHGMWDLAMLGIVPGIRIAAPRDAETLTDELAEAVDTPGPTALRFPKAELGVAVPAVRRTGGVDVLRDVPRPDVLIVAVGVMAAPALEAAERLAVDGIDCTVVDPRWVLPVPPALLTLASGAGLVVTVEDGVRAGGAGSRIALEAAEHCPGVAVRCLGLPDEYLPHGKRSAILAAHGLDADGIVATVRAAARRLPGPRLALVPEQGERVVRVRSR